MRNELTNWEIRTAVEANPYLSPQDLVYVAKKKKMTLRNVQNAVSGKIRKSKANGLLIELGRKRKAEAQIQAEEIINLK